MSNKINKIAMIEFSNLLLDKERDILDIHNREFFYNKSSSIGYKKTVDFCEFPRWTNFVASLFHGTVERKLLICRDIQETVYDIISNGYDYIFFSNIEATNSYILDIIERILNYKDIQVNTQFVIGNGIGSKFKLPNAKKFKNIHIYDNMQDFMNIHAIGRTISHIRYTSMEDDYNSRIYTTSGCKNNCKFCENEGSFELIPENIISNINPTRVSNLVYVGNKTFMQGGRRELETTANIYKNSNFIVQSSISTLYKHIHELHLLRDNTVTVVEIGVESFNESTIKYLGKNNNFDHLDTIVKALNDLDIKVIFNIMLGIPNENIGSFTSTIKNLEYYKDKLYAINVTNYADYKSKYDIDRDERYLFPKSWIRDKDTEFKNELRRFQETVYHINYEILINH